MDRRPMESSALMQPLVLRLSKGGLPANCLGAYVLGLLA